MSAEISECAKNPQHLLLEAIHSVGYSGPYANSLLASESSVSRLNSTVLEEFVAVSLRYHIISFSVLDLVPRLVMLGSLIDKCHCFI